MERLRALLREGLEERLYLGACFRVLRLPDRVLAEGAAGLAQEEPRLPATTATLWDMASLTKPLATATSILLLAQEGALHLGDEVGRFLPACGPGLGGVTLRHLLTHTSGLKAWERFHSQELARAEIVRRVRASERQRPPGTGYTYSDLGYILLGEVVEAVSGETLAGFSRRRVFEPLEMTETGFLPPPERFPGVAATRCPDRGRVLVGEVHDGNCAAMGGIAGHAGLFSTLDDVMLYARMLLDEGSLGGTRLLSRLAAREMARNQNPPGMNGHTLGWFTRPSGFLPAADFLPADAFGHTGFTGTSLVLCPSLGLAVALLTNRVYMERDAGEFLRFRRRFHNAAAALVQ